MPAEYFSSGGGIAPGKHTLNEALDVVFLGGKRVTLALEAPDGFLEGILQVRLFRL